MTAWYLVGSPGILPQSDTEAYLWAKKAAEAGLAKAQYAVGYFTEVRKQLQPRDHLKHADLTRLRSGQVGIGTDPSTQDALYWYQQAADQGDKRAAQRLRSNGTAVGGVSQIGRDKDAEKLMKDRRNSPDGGPDAGDKEGCVVM